MFQKTASILLSKLIAFSFCLGMGMLIALPEGLAQNTGNRNTGLPLPRFVSLKSSQVNMRVGPGQEFKVLWKYVKRGLPMEIIQEYFNWRKVRDPEGNEGWILHSLLSGKRMVIISPWEENITEGLIKLRSEASENASVIANVEPGVIGEVFGCGADWCRVQLENISGFIEKKSIWGVYPDELLEE